MEIELMKMARTHRAMFYFWTCPLLSLAMALGSSVTNLSAAISNNEVGPTKAMPRRPIAVEFLPDARNILVANRRSGTISVVDVDEAAVVAELQVARTIGDLQALSDHGGWVASDFADHRLILLGHSTGGQGGAAPPVLPQTLQTIETVPFPAAIDVDRSGNRLAVAGFWSRCVAIHVIGPEDRLFPATPISLPFVPGDLAWIQGKIVVTAAFEPRIAVVDARTASVHTTWIPDHRLSRIAGVPNESSVWISSTRLNPLGRSNRNDVHWGLMISNRVGIFEAGRLVELENQATFDDYRLLGDTGNAKGDPGEVVFSDSYQVIALEGVDQIAIASHQHEPWAYLDVGARPVDIAISEHTAVVANMLDDSVSIVRLDTLQHVQTVPLGPPRPRTIVERGERLFFDASQSHDGWMSCHTCHVEGHTNHLLNDNFSDSSFGTPKLVISLLGHAATAPFAWDGSRPNLETQIRNSLEVTMQADEPPADETVVALVAYVNQLPAPPISAAGPTSAPQIAAGARLFADLGCAHCHTPPNYTTSETFDVGFEDEQGKRAFNPPSLIAAGWRSRFFHDGRAHSLEEVVERFRHQLKRELSDQERQQLLRYLQSL